MRYVLTYPLIEGVSERTANAGVSVKAPQTAHEPLDHLMRASQARVVRPVNHSLKRYPTPRTVTMCDAIWGPTFERTLLMWTSTVRVPPQYSKPHTR